MKIDSDFKCAKGPFLSINGNTLAVDSNGVAKITLDASAAENFSKLASIFGGEDISFKANSVLSVQSLGDKGFLVASSPGIAIGLKISNVTVNSVQFSSAGIATNVDAKYLPLLTGTAEKRVQSALNDSIGSGGISNVIKAILDAAKKNNTGMCFRITTGGG